MSRVQSPSFTSLLVRLFVAVVIVALVAWFTTQILLPLIGLLIGLLIPVAFLALLFWFVYKILSHEPPT